MAKTQPGRPRQQIRPGTAKRLIAYLSASKLRLTVVVLCIFCSAAAGACISVFLKILIDDFITPMLGLETPDFSGLLRAIMLMAVVYGIGALSTLIYNRMMVVIEQQTLKRIRNDMFNHMQSLPISYFDSRSHGDLMSLYTNDTDTLRMAISQSLPQILSAFFATLSALVAMITLSINMTFVVLLFSLVIWRVVRFLVSRSAKHFIRQQQNIGDVNGFVEEMVNGLRVVKVFCREEKTQEAFEVKNSSLRETATAANNYGNIMMPVIVNMGYFLYVLLGMVGGAAGIIGIPNYTVMGVTVLSLGTIASFVTLSRGFVNPIGQISMQINSIISALAGASRIFELMDEQSEICEGYVTLVNAKTVDSELTECAEHTGNWAWKHPHSDGTITYTPLRGEIVFTDVTFGYKEGSEVLHNISLYAKPGQKLAFVGATGAGKTTITNLINRFYDIADGKIRYDGININKIKKADLRRSLGVVLQDVNLFTGTVMDNIRYGKLDATDNECIAAAKLVNAHEFIQMLPQAYETVLEGDGSGLSQGQRQLISIARAAVADPPVMILDEATSSIDTRTEAIVQRGMDALMKDRTVFVIAHRLSTVQNSNVIIVLEDGNIIERGSHEQLLAEKGKYYQLYTGVFELE